MHLARLRALLRSVVVCAVLVSMGCGETVMDVVLALERSTAGVQRDNCAIGVEWRDCPPALQEKCDRGDTCKLATLESDGRISFSDDGLWCAACSISSHPTWSGWPRHDGVCPFDIAMIVPDEVWRDLHARLPPAFCNDRPLVLRFYNRTYPGGPPG